MRSAISYCTVTVAEANGLDNNRFEITGVATQYGRFETRRNRPFFPASRRWFSAAPNASSTRGESLFFPAKTSVFMRWTLSASISRS